MANLFCSTNDAGIRVKPLARITGPLPLRTPKTAQMATPPVKRLYIKNEIERVSSVRNVLMACGKKLKVVRAAAK